MFSMVNEDFFRRAVAGGMQSASWGSSHSLPFLKKQFVFPFKVFIISVKYSLFLSWKW